MVVCTGEQQDVPEERLDELPLSKRKEMAKKFTWNHGSELNIFPISSTFLFSRSSFEKRSKETLS